MLKQILKYSFGTRSHHSSDQQLRIGTYRAKHCIRTMSPQSASIFILHPFSDYISRQIELFELVKNIQGQAVRTVIIGIKS